MPTEKPTSQKLTLSSLATARPSQTPESEQKQPAIANTNTVAPDAQPPVSPADVPSASRFGDKKPQSSQSKDLKTLESVTNAAGEVFKAEDRIQVEAPWRDSAVAEIVTLYQDLSGGDWASYLPIEPSPPTNWSWLGGCTRASLLVKST